jgi:hypothetical protein
VSSLWDRLSCDRRRSRAAGDLLVRPKPSIKPPLALFVVVPQPDGKTHQDGGKDKPEPPKGSAGKGPGPTSPLPPAKPKGQGSAAPKPPPRAEAAIPGDTRRLSRKAREAAARLPLALRRALALNTNILLRSRFNNLNPRTDNSNTQFAVLGLLAAQSYDVPMERAMTPVDGLIAKPGGRPSAK